MSGTEIAVDPSSQTHFSHIRTVDARRTRVTSESALDAGEVLWWHLCFPSKEGGFDSRRPLHTLTPPVSGMGSLSLRGLLPKCADRGPDFNLTQQLKKF